VADHTDFHGNRSGEMAAASLLGLERVEMALPLGLRPDLGHIFGGGLTPAR
jgi:hypothetical protein